MLIWWTNQADCEAIEEAHEGLPQYLPAAHLPRYIQAQYRSRCGRNGRGRLWADSSFGEPEVKPWPGTAMGRLLGEIPRLGQTYAGIVIDDADAPLLDFLPGIITTFELKRWHGVAG